jgi:hypothetical protein
MKSTVHSKKIVEVVRGFLHLWLPGIVQKKIFYFGRSSQDHLWDWHPSSKQKIMEMFYLSTEGMIAHMMRQSRSIPSVFQHSYRFFCNQEYIIHNTVTRPVQFSLDSLPTMSSFTQKLGSGWEGINENKYFNTDELQKDVEMTTSEDYEKAYIQLMTMRLIKVV